MSAHPSRVAEIAPGIYRINTPVDIPGGPGQFSFNQYLIVDDEPLLFHTGMRAMFAGVREARSWHSARTACAGTTRPTCRTPGSAA
jgi:hypothetical protein